MFLGLASVTWPTVAQPARQKNGRTRLVPPRIQQAQCTVCDCWPTKVRGLNGQDKTPDYALAAAPPLYLLPLPYILDAPTKCALETQRQC